MVGSMEQAIADIFNEHFRDWCRQQGKRPIVASLAGQDEKMGADYLISDSSMFALIEFKFLERKLKVENVKDLRLNLCIRMEQESDIVESHDKCHFISWASNPLSDMIINIYRKEICNKQIWRNDNLAAEKRDITCRLNAHEFIEDFLNDPPIFGLDHDKFSSYVRTLSEISEGGSGGGDRLFLLIRDDTRKRLGMVLLSSVLELKEWLENNPRPAPTYTI